MRPAWTRKEDDGGEGIPKSKKRKKKKPKKRKTDLLPGLGKILKEIQPLIKKAVIIAIKESARYYIGKEIRKRSR